MPEFRIQYVIGLSDEEFLDKEQFMKIMTMEMKRHNLDQVSVCYDFKMTPFQSWASHGIYGLFNLYWV